MRHGVMSNLRWKARGGIVAWSTCSISMVTPMFFQSCWRIWPLARPRGVAVNSILNATGLPYSLISALALLTSSGSAPSSLHLTHEPSP